MPHSPTPNSAAAFVPAVLGLLLTACGFSDTTRISNGDTRYAVVEFTLLEGVDHEGPASRYRVGLLEHLGSNRQAYLIEEVGLCTEPRCARVGERAGTGLVASWGMLHRRGLTEDWAVGDPHIVDVGDRLSVYSTFSQYSQRDVRGVGPTQPVRIEATVVRRCPAQVRWVAWSGFEWRVAGIAGIPRRVQADWVELQADCLEPGDPEIIAR